MPLTSAFTHERREARTTSPAEVPTRTPRALFPSEAARSRAEAIAGTVALITLAAVGAGLVLMGYWLMG